MGRLLGSVLENEGEGIILQKPKSVYEGGRPSTLFKIKVLREDLEALVLDIADKNKFYTLKLPNGVVFNIDPQNFKLKIGDIVSIEFDSYAKNGAPISPRLSRIRTDVSWKEILQDHANNTKQKAPRNTSSVNKSIRQFFVNFARERNLNPFDPATWYPVARRSFMKEEDGPNILDYFNNDHIKALQQAFPELEFDAMKFATIPSSFWRSAANRRSAFVNFAHSRGFDPLVAKNWQSVDKDQVTAAKPMRRILRKYYDKKLGRALTHLFPEISLDKNEFYTARRALSHRQFMLKFARTADFDPLLAENWYSVTPSTILAHKGLRFLLNRYYDGKLVNALPQLFPEMHFDTSMLTKAKDQADARDFFFIFAKERNFDPLVAENWYKYSSSDFQNRPRGKQILALKDGSFAKVIQYALPEVEFQDAQFSFIPQFFWKDIPRRRDFLAQFANENDFDPLIADNWYSLPLETVHNDKGARSMLQINYDGKLSKALIHLFPEIGFDSKKFIAMHEYLNKTNNAVLKKLL